MTDRARFRTLFEEATGLVVSHYAEPGAAGRGPAVSWIVRAGGLSFAVRTLGDARAAPVAFAAERLRSAAAEAGAIPLLVVPRMGSVGAQTSLDRGVGFLDLEGNARLEAPGLRVRVERRSRPRRPPGRPASAFAPRASRVARVLLEDPRRSWRQHELAAASGLGAGYVSRIVRRMERDGLVARDADGGLRARDPAVLFDAWREDYGFRPRRVLERVAAVSELPGLVERLPARLARRGVDHAVSGLAALWLRDAVAPLSSLTLYVAELPPEALLDGLRLAERPASCNVRLAVPRDAGLLESATRRRGVRTLGAVQALLDAERIPELAPGEAAALGRELLGQGPPPV